MERSNSLDAVDFASWLDQATAGNHLPNPWLEVSPDLSDANRANSALYIRALRSRLHTLGYLGEEDRDGNTLTSELSEAVKRFQREAALTEDGWAGPLTKRRLQQLVSFEEEQAPANWDTAGRDLGQLQAVRRAVYVRLYTLGFMDWDEVLTAKTEVDPSRNSVFRDALGRFLAAMQTLNQSPRSCEPVLDIPVLSLVFGHDAMVRALARNPGFVDERSNRKFIESIGKVELWLLDYDVRLADGDNTRFEPAPPRGQTSVKHIDAVQDALADLDARFPEANLPDPGLFRPRKFSVEFFTLTSSLCRAAEREVFNPEIEDGILNAARSSSAEIMDKLNRLATRVWDGIKRLWGFLKSLVKKAVGIITDQIWRIARMISAKARGAFEVVLKAIEIVHRGAVYMRSRIFPGSQPETALLLFSRDFDAAFIVKEEASLLQAQQIAESDARETCLFVAACRILACLVNILVEICRVVILEATQQWFLILLSLSRVASQLRGVIDGVSSVDLDSIKGFHTQDGALYSNSTT